LADMKHGVHAGLAARRQHNLVHAELPGILAVESRRLAERELEIGRADIDRIDPGRIKDLVDVLNRLTGLDHRNYEDLVICGLLIGTCDAVHGGADRAVAALSLWRITAVGNERLRLLARVHHRAY